jgi:RNA recognition motif-containing protein
MSAVTEKVGDVVSNAVSGVTNALANISISDKDTASANEGRRLYIGNLAYATTDEELKAFFTGYQMYVSRVTMICFP